MLQYIKCQYSNVLLQYGSQMTSLLYPINSLLIKTQPETIYKISMFNNIMFTLQDKLFIANNGGHTNVYIFSHVARITANSMRCKPLILEPNKISGLCNMYKHTKILNDRSFKRARFCRIVLKWWGRATKQWVKDKTCFKHKPWLGMELTVQWDHRLAVRF